MYLAAETVPMLRLSGGGVTLQRFTLHDLACDVYRRAALERWWRGDDALFLGSMKALADRSDYQRLFQTLLDSGDQELLVAFAEKLGAGSTRGRSTGPCWSWYSIRFLQSCRLEV